MASLFDAPYRSDKAAYQAAYYKANKAAIKAKRAKDPLAWAAQNGRLL